MYIDAEIYNAYITNNIIIILEIDMSRTLGSDQGQCICSAKCGQNSQGRGKSDVSANANLRRFRDFKI